MGLIVQIWFVILNNTIFTILIEGCEFAQLQYGTAPCNDCKRHANSQLLLRSLYLLVYQMLNGSMFLIDRQDHQVASHQIVLKVIESAPCLPFGGMR